MANERNRIKLLACGGCVVLLLAIATAGICREEEGAGTIAITIVDVQPSQGGTVVIALFDGKEHWLKPDKAFVRKTVPAAMDSMTVQLDGIPYGNVYAIQIFHDKNENGKFDMRRFPYPKPKEGAGVSNNKLRFGPPEYDKARFTLSQPAVSLRIRMNY